MTAATLDDFVTHRDVDEYLNFFDAHAVLLREKVINPLQELDFIFRLIKYHHTDSRIDCIGIYVRPQPGEEVAYLYPCDRRAGLIQVGAIHLSDLVTKPRIRVSTYMPERHPDVPVSYTRNFNRVLLILKEAGIKPMSV